MITILDKKNCCGCEACVNVCPQRCITMREDEEGFKYPSLDLSHCIDCGLCERVCPVLNRGDKRLPKSVLAGRNSNDAIRAESSSGGVFTLLAERIIEEGGVVFGARFDDSWEGVEHIGTDQANELQMFRGSKYLQSRIGDTFNEVAELLKSGRKVLFSGTPCQIAGLKRALRREYDNLFTVEVICHGVPSPLVWRNYLSTVKGEREIESITFRNKDTGWRNYRFKVDFKGGGSHAEPMRKNIFMRGFLYDLYLRPSCHECPAKGGSSGADMAIADFWGIERFHPEFDDDKGVNLMLLYSDKAVELIDTLSLQTTPAKYEEGLHANPCIERSVAPPRSRAAFWKQYEQQGSKAIYNACRRIRRHRKWQRLKQRITKLFR